MAPKASSKPDSGSSSSATIGFEAHFHSFGIRHSDFFIHPDPRLAICGIKADIGKEHATTFRNVQHLDVHTDYVLANGSMSSNQSGDCPAQSASSKLKNTQENPPRQGEFRRASPETCTLNCKVAVANMHATLHI